MMPIFHAIGALVILIGWTIPAASGEVAASRNAFNRYECERRATLPTELGVAGAIVGIDHGVLIVAGGSNFPGAAPWYGGVKRYYSDICTLPLDSDDSAGWQRETLRLPREMGHAAVTHSPQGLVCLGGEMAIGPLDHAFLLRFDPSAQAVAMTELPRLPMPRTAAAAAILGKRVYLLGGQNEFGALDDMLSLDLENPEQGWSHEPSLPEPLAFSVAVTQSDGQADRIYLFGGRAKKAGDSVTTFSDAAYSYSAETGRWSAEPRLPFPLAAGCGTSLGTCSILLFGGDDGTLFNINEQLRQAGKNESDPDAKRQLLAERCRHLESHPGFRREVLQFNTITKTWSVPAQFSDGFPVATAACLHNEKGIPTILLPGGESRPGVRTNEVIAFRILGQPRFALLDYAVLAVYLLGMLGIGFLFLRKEGTAGDFFLGGGRLPWWAVGISIFATTLSAITFLSFPAKSFAADWRMLPYNFGILMVAPVIIRYYLPYFRRLNLTTAYEYLERRFNRAVRRWASGLFILFMVSRIAIVLYLPSLALNVATGLDVYCCILVMASVTIIYCTLGGMEAVVWGDVVQGVILVGGALLSLVVLACSSDGGWFGLFSTASDAGKLATFDFRLSITQPVFWLVLLGAFANNMITYSSDQTIVQRYMCGTDERQAKRSIWLNALLAIPVTFLFFMVGTALFTYYRSHPERFDTALGSPDAIYPLFIVNGLPPGVSGLVIAAVFAAAMSTLSSNINSASAAVYADFLQLSFPKWTQRFPVLIPQAAGIVIGLAGTILAIFLATWDIKSLWDLFNAFLGLFTGPVGGLFFMGIFSKRINATGAMAGLIASSLLVGIIQHYTPVSFLLYGLIGMSACFVIAYGVSLFAGGTPQTVMVATARSADNTSGGE